MAAQLGQARNALGSLAGRVRSAVQPATQLVEKEVVDRYTKLIEANKEYVVKDKSAADKLMKQWFYTKARQVPTWCITDPPFPMPLLPVPGRRACERTRRPSHSGFAAQAADKRREPLRSIPDGIQHAKEEVGVVEKKWAQRSEMPLSEVRRVPTCTVQQHPVHLPAASRWPRMAYLALQEAGRHMLLPPATRASSLPQVLE